MLKSYHCGVHKYTLANRDTLLLDVTTKDAVRHLNCTFELGVSDTTFIVPRVRKYMYLRL